MISLKKFIAELISTEDAQYDFSRCQKCITGRLDILNNRLTNKFGTNFILEIIQSINAIINKNYF